MTGAGNRRRRGTPTTSRRMNTRMDGMARPKATAASDTAGGNRRLNGRPTTSPASRPARTPWHGRKWRPSPTPQAAIDDSTADRPQARHQDPPGRRGTAESGGPRPHRRRQSTTQRRSTASRAPGPRRTPGRGREATAAAVTGAGNRRRRGTPTTSRRMKTRMDGMARPKATAASDTAGGNRRLNGRPTASPASRPTRTPWHGRKWQPSPTPQAAIDRKPGSRARRDAGARPRSDGRCRERRVGTGGVRSALFRYGRHP
ncbi:hypothetical protein M2164_007592 [Streptomyces sp. SAI-208]|nr:hypothetical protein [Streptomyces sp. SAI-208]